MSSVIVIISGYNGRLDRLTEGQLELVGSLYMLPRRGTLIFSAYVGSDPASTFHPKKYQEFQTPPKIFEILATQKNIPILYLDLKKGPKIA